MYIFLSVEYIFKKQKNRSRKKEDLLNEQSAPVHAGTFELDPNSSYVSLRL
jgi:hypothetical protein